MDRVELVRRKYGLGMDQDILFYNTNLYHIITILISYVPNGIIEEIKTFATLCQIKHQSA